MDNLKKKPTHRLIILLLTLVFIQLSVAPAASASSSTNAAWPMFRGDLVHSGYTYGNGEANSVKLLWSYLTMQAVWSSPAVANGYIYFGCKDFNIFCLNASNSELVWYFWTGGEVNSSPAVSNGRVYVGSDDGYVYCLNTSTSNLNKTGVLFWKTEIGGLVHSSPAVVGERVYIGSGAKDFFCLNASDGSILWRYPTRFRINSSPAVSEGVVFFACDDFSTYALNATSGREIWQHHTGSNVNSPTISNGRLYIGGYTGYVFCLDAATGHEIWRFKTEDSIASSAAVAYGCVYIGGEDNSLYCLNASIGKKIWRAPTGYWVWGSPTVSDGNVFVGSEDYYIYCFNASTGNKKWSFLTECYVDSSPAIADGVLYVGSHDHHLYALALNDSANDQSPLESENQISWTTVAFDSIVLVMIAAIVTSIVKFTLSTKNCRQESNPAVLNQKRAWLSAHADALCIIAILTCSSVFLINLGKDFLWAADEQTYSSMAYHMVRNGDFLTPWGLGDYAIWTGKPPLVMWTMALSFQVFGVNNFAVRLPSVVFGAFSLIMVYFLGKKLYGVHVGALSALILGTFATFYEFATHAMLDMPFVFFTIASIYFIKLSEDAQHSNRYAVLSGLFFACALLTKLIEALLIPLVIFIYFLITRRSLRFLFTKRIMLFLGVAALLLVPWMIYMDRRFFGDFWQCYFVYTGFMRTVSPLEGHGGDLLFYFNYLTSSENLLWIALLPLAIGFSVFKAMVKRAKADMLILCWMGIVLLVFTLAQTKLYWYMLPALPAFALAIGSLLIQAVKWLHKRSQRSTR